MRRHSVNSKQFYFWLMRLEVCVHNCAREEDAAFIPYYKVLQDRAEAFTSHSNFFLQYPACQGRADVQRNDLDSGFNLVSKMFIISMKTEVSPYWWCIESPPYMSTCIYRESIYVSLYCWVVMWFSNWSTAYDQAKTCIQTFFYYIGLDYTWTCAYTCMNTYVQYINTCKAS